MEKVFDKSLVRSGMQRRKGQVGVVFQEDIVQVNVPVLRQQGAFRPLYPGDPAFFQG